MVRKLLSLYLVAFLVCPVAAFAAEVETHPDYVVLPIEAGDIVPFDGILLSLDAAGKVLTEKQFEDAECDLRVEYELQLQSEAFQLQLDYKDIELTSWKDKYESMMILKSAEITRLQEFAMQPKPADGPLFVALGFGIGTLTSLGIFAISTELVQ